MDKQKQIEEMPVQCTDGRFEVIKEIQDYMLSATNMTEEEAYSFAFSCWQCNFKKIPENAVVLTREELDKYLGCEISTLVVRIVYLEKQLKKSRKETAEKFAERAKESAEIKALAIVMGGKLYPIYKAIANKIDEICKEITEE